MDDADHALALGRVEGKLESFQNRMDSHATETNERLRRLENGRIKLIALVSAISTAVGVSGGHLL